MESNPTTPPNPAPTEALADLVLRALKGDTSTLSELRQFLDAHPEVVHEAGNLVAQAQTAWTKLAAGPNLVVEESIQRELVAMKNELGWASATPLERLLIDQVVLSNMAVGFASTRDAQSAREPMTVGQRDHLQRRVERAQRRLMAGVKMLATVRKLSQRPRSPIEIASWLGNRQSTSSALARDKRLALGTGVEN